MASNVADKKDEANTLPDNETASASGAAIACSSTSASAIAANGLSTLPMGITIEPNGQAKLNLSDFQTIKAASDTLKRNPKLEFSKTDLLKLLSYLEGELQARDVVIAALKSEKVKQLLYAMRYKPIPLNDPQAALFRDNLAAVGNIASKQSSTAAAQSEQETRWLAEQQMESLENLVMKQRQTQMKMINVLREADEKHKRVMMELDEEKRKHERDTAQGDDITYGLEMERTRLKQELEQEVGAHKRTDKDLKRVQEVLDQERARQKQIVLLLLAERKKIIMKYIEERKRSEDLAQILSEEKQRVDSIAEGLEEESKKSLRMEAEMEKQTQTFDNERKTMKFNLAKEEKRIKELESELNQLKAENEQLRKQQQQRTGGSSGGAGGHMSGPQLPLKGGLSGRIGADPIDDTAAASPMMSSVAKVVQPTATVSSVPVSGPTTGIARSISPGQSLRQQSTDVSTFNATKVVPRKLSNSTTPACAIMGGGTGILSSATSSTSISSNNQLLKTQASLGGGGGSSGGAQTATIKKAGGSQAMGRGVPPPIPPNKPVIPPKREPSVTRMNSTANSAAKDNTSTIVGGGGGKEPAIVPTAAVGSNSNSGGISNAAAAAGAIVAATTSAIATMSGNLEAANEDGSYQDFQQIPLGMVSK